MNVLMSYVYLMLYNACSINPHIMAVLEAFWYCIFSHIVQLFV